MRSPALFLLAVLFVASSFAFSAAPLSAEPALVVGPASVVVEGASPDGEVAWLSVSRRPLGTHQQVEIRRELGQADASGRAELELADKVTAKSIWAVVDLATGEYVVAAPASGILRERALLPDAFLADSAGEAALLRHDRLRVEVLVVRPAAETEPARAWAGQVRDGGELDEGLANDGEISLSPRTLPGLVDGQKPAEYFAPGDVVVLIDPERLEVSIARLEAGAGQGGEQ